MSRTSAAHHLWWRLLSLALLSGALVLANATGSLAQECTGSCGGGICTFGGMLNVPLGDASISITEECHLLVDNIGESAEDGVVQTDLTGVYMKTNLVTPNFSGAITGTLARIRQVGIVDGQPGGEVMLTRIWGDGDNLGMSVNCTALSVAGYSIDIYNGGELVGHIDHPQNSPIVLFPKTDVRSIACGIYPDGDVYTVIELGAPVPITITTLPTTPPPIVGDMLFIEAFSPAELPTSMTDIENRFLMTGPVLMETMVEFDTLPCGGQFPFVEPCTEVAVPAVPPAGLLVLVLMLIAAATATLQSRRRVPTGFRNSV